MGRGDTDGGDLPVVEVFARDARHAPPASKGSIVHDPPRRRLGTRGCIVIATLAIGVSVVVVGSMTTGEGRDADPVDDAQAGVRGAEPPDPFAADAVFDGAARHTVGVVGETCCDRPAVVVRGSDPLGGHARAVAADVAGIPGAAVFAGPGGSQLVALGSGGARVVVAAEASRPFTPAELATLRDHVAVAVDQTGSVRLVVDAPLVARVDDGPAAGPPSSFSVGRTTPLRTDQTTFVAGGADSGTVVAIDRWTGRLLWASTVGSAAFLDGVVGDLVVVAAGPGRVVGLDVFTGAPRSIEIPLGPP
ncbi:MAG: hypothetical protein RIE08_13905 [Acidimicrobiales bacterium]